MLLSTYSYLPPWVLAMNQSCLQRAKETLRESEALRHKHFLACDIEKLWWFEGHSLSIFWLSLQVLHVSVLCVSGGGNWEMTNALQNITLTTVANWLACNGSLLEKAHRMWDKVIKDDGACLVILLHLVPWLYVPFPNKVCLRIQSDNESVVGLLLVRFISHL